MPTRIRILVIEDDVLVAFAVMAILQDEGWIVVGPIGRLSPAIEASAEAEFDLRACGRQPRRGIRGWRGGQPAKTRQAVCARDWTQ